MRVPDLQAALATEEAPAADEQEPEPAAPEQPPAEEPRLRRGVLAPALLIVLVALIVVLVVWGLTR
jgi:hypothetical protein